MDRKNRFTSKRVPNSNSNQNHGRMSETGSPGRGGRARSRESGQGSPSRSPSRSRSPTKAPRSPGGDALSDPESPTRDGDRRGRSRSRKTGRHRSASGRRSSSAGGEGGSPSRSGSRGRSPGSRKSRSPPKFGEKDFDKKSGAMDVRKRQSAISKARGLKSDPSEWTRQELADRVKKFARFTQDNKTNVGELTIEGKRFASEDIAVLHEVLRRFTEIQTVKMNNCFINDDMFVGICASLRNLRHMKHLSLEGNLLTSTSCALLIRTFSRAARKVQVLELRGNSFLYQDGYDLHQAFPFVNKLSGINVELYNKDFMLGSMELGRLNLKLPEMGVLCSMLELLPTIFEIKLQHNQLNAKALIQLITSLQSRPFVSRLDLSYNPITNDSTDFKGLETLMEVLRRSKQFTHIKLDGIPNLPPFLMAAITQSLQVNRAVKSVEDGYYFSKFITGEVERRTAARDAKRPSPETGLVTLAEWTPRFDVVDIEFVRKNRLPGVTVSVTGDEINVKRVPYPKFNQYTF